MILRQKRINNANYFMNAIEGSEIVFRVEDISRHPDKLEIFGFSKSDCNGCTILPSIFNKYSYNNAEQYTTINRTLPKEKYYQTVYWTRTEWAGRGETRQVTEFTDIPRERYHRDYHEPFSVYFTLEIENDVHSIVSDPIKYSIENIPKLINTANMLLGLFGECTVCFDSKEPLATKIRCDWEFLPKGHYPWNQVKESIANLCKTSTNTQKQMMLRNCEEINSCLPDFVAYGRSGFKGYVVFGFTDKNLYILESIYPNNATYVFQNTWEDLSKMTKAEIISNKLHKARIIHNSHWVQNFSQIMQASNE